jgi:hypothetical protein
LYPNMQPLPKRKRTETSVSNMDASKKRKRFDPKTPSSRKMAKKNVKSPKVTDFSNELLSSSSSSSSLVHQQSHQSQTLISPSSEKSTSPVSSRTPVSRGETPPSMIFKRSVQQHREDDESHPSSHISHLYSNFLDLQPLDSFEDINFDGLLDEDTNEVEKESDEDALGDSEEGEDDEDEDEEDGSNLHMQKVAFPNEPQIAQTLDFFDALEAFFSEQKANEPTNILPLFTDDVISKTIGSTPINNDSLEFDSIELFNILQDNSSSSLTSLQTDQQPQQPQQPQYSQLQLQPCIQMNYPQYNATAYDFNSDMMALSQMSQYPFNNYMNEQQQFGQYGQFGNPVQNSSLNAGIPSHSVLSDFDDLFAM